jgi:hypothetical protein
MTTLGEPGSDDLIDDEVMDRIMKVELDDEAEQKADATEFEEWREAHSAELEHTNAE